MFQGFWHDAQIVRPESSRTENKKMETKSMREAFNTNKLENKEYSKLESGAGVAQLVSARLSEQEVPGSILGDFNVCFDFPLIL